MWSCPNRLILVIVAAFSLTTGTTVQAATTISQGAVVEVDQNHRQPDHGCVSQG